LTQKPPNEDVFLRSFSPESPSKLLIDFSGTTFYFSLPSTCIQLTFVKKALIRCFMIF